jgi:hypothetical protein
MSNSAEIPIPLQILMPKNFSRVNPLVYIFLVAFAFVFFGLIWFGYLKVLVLIGAFLIVIYGLSAYFWRNPLTS